MRDDGTVSIGLVELASGSRLKSLMASYRSDRHVPVADANAGSVEPLETPVATGFVVVDYLGRAVACTPTMNALFGTGRVVPGMGILLAAPPTAAQGGAASLGPVIVTGNKSPEVYFAAAATGGDAAPTALINVAVRLFANGLSLDDALAAPRLHHGAAPQPVYYEKGMSDRVLKSLAERGHQLAVAKRLGLVNAVLCREGLPVSPESCSAKADPRGYGLAAIVD